MVVNNVFDMARARLMKRIEDRNTYLDVEFEPAELDPPARPVTLRDMLLDVSRDCGGDAKAVASDLRLGK